MATPQCLNDYLWIGMMAIVGLAIWLIKLMLNKGIIERLDKMAERQEHFFTACHDCQLKNQAEFVHNKDFLTFLSLRSEDHKVLNGRIGHLEIGQGDIGNKIETFHADMREKMNRLSKTFVFRDAVISMRLDNLSDKVGVDKWTKEQEQKLAEDLKEKFEVPE